MIKYLLLSLSIIIANHSTASDGQAICYFASLPVELQDHIAYFLQIKDREPVSEFIERTREPAIVPTKSYKRFLKHYKRDSERASSPYNGYGYCAYYSPDQSKVALFELPPGTRDTPSRAIITVIDAKTKKKIYRKKSRYCLILIALSQRADMFAYIRRHIGPCKDNATEEEKAKWTFEYVLVVKHVDTKQIQKFIIPYTYQIIRSIGFNKQGTHIVMHGIDDAQLSEEEYDANLVEFPSKHHIIYPLVKEHKTLSEYFKNKLVCKNFS